ncbi:Uu.00g000790.m01.CDS01 [Anthostomella pinea]|uniref:Uu.00g000790.m01.CDS01 n=1 Tax=Anthostomella pinea TaxID=933095 RepID=A0AAI8VKD6_9PEZI|nr:Uu.00g000790.m01.CDS01 [Anthostomella pinea]
MTTRLLPRALAGARHSHHALGAGLGLSLGTGMMLSRNSKLRFDSRTVLHAASFSSTDSLGAKGQRDAEKGVLSAELMRQLSGGSITGFAAGLLVSVFSRTLVLLLGLSVVVVQVASRYGINIVQQLRLKQRLGNPRVLAALEKDPAFKLSFGMFFAMSAFMQF